MGRRTVRSKDTVIFRVVPRSLRDPRRNDEDFGVSFMEPVYRPTRDGGPPGNLTAKQKELIEYFTETEVQEVALDPSKGIYGREHGEEDFYREESDDYDDGRKSRAVTIEDLKKKFGEITVTEDPSMHGIFFDNQEQYDYMQHLKEVDQPSSAIRMSGSRIENGDLDIHVHDDTEDGEVSRANKSDRELNRVDKDPEIAEVERALDDSDYIRSDLSDGFFQALNAEDVPEKYLVDEITGDSCEYSSPPEGEKLDRDMRSLEERRSIDEDFEELLKQKYNEEDDGKPANINRSIELETLSKYFVPFEGQEKLKPAEDPGYARDLDESEKKIIIAFDKLDESDSSVELVVLEHNSRIPHTDVTSAVEINPNPYNHPKIIADTVPRKYPKTKSTRMPVIHKPSADIFVTPINRGKSRDKNETPEQKKARKVAQKTERRTKREEKKEIKFFYRAETLKRAANYNPLVNSRTVKI